MDKICLQIFVFLDCSIQVLSNFSKERDINVRMREFLRFHDKQKETVASRTGDATINLSTVLLTQIVRDFNPFTPNSATYRFYSV